MINQLSQENIAEYATDATTIDPPAGTDYTRGVQVGKTIPAKWWNWLFRAVTARAQQARVDADNMLSELKNTVVDAGLTPDPEDNTQLSQAANVLAVRGVNTYVQDKKRGYFSSWTTESCTGIRSFDSADLVTIDELKPIPNSEEKAFYLRLKQHTSSPSNDYYWHYTSTDLVNWHEISGPMGVNFQTADIIYFKGRYYFLFSEKDVHTAQLYYSDDAASWYLSRSFTEYGALGLRIAANVLWMISASYQTYADINYYSYYTTDGSSWANAGVVFRNSMDVEDKVGEVASFQGSYILGNKITTDGLTWSVIITDWSNSAFSTVIITGGSAAVIQFNDTENAWYVLGTPSGTPVKYTGTWVIKSMGPENRILAEDSSDGYAGLTMDGVTFVKLSIEYPTDPLAEFSSVIITTF